MAESLALPLKSLLLGIHLSLSSPPLYTSTTMNTVTNDQGNHVYAHNIARFVATGEKIPGNHAFKYVWRDFPLQQSSHLDRRVHKVSRAGREAGEYPSGYKVHGYDHLRCLLC